MLQTVLKQRAHQLIEAASGEKADADRRFAGVQKVGTVLANLDGSVEPSSEPRHGAVVLQVGTQLKSRWILSQAGWLANFK
jgi:hypothetical protein